MRTNKDRTCICCGDTIPAGSSRMIPKHAKANHGLCFPCFRKWKDTGGDLKLMDNPGDAKK
nr:MAG TPA: zinc finger protein [Caudoviricetes sp.]